MDSVKTSIEGSRALVTGIAGFIGSTLANELLTLGVRVRGIDRFSDYYSPEIKRRNIDDLLAHPDCEFIEGDLASADIGSLVDGVDWIFHLAAQPGVRASWGHTFRGYLRDNLEASQRLLEGCIDIPLERVVMASSSSVYGNATVFPTTEEAVPQPVSPYGVTKLAMEHLARQYYAAYSVPVILLRYFTVYGPRQRPDMAFNRFVARALRNEPLHIFGDGRQIRDFTFVSDAVHGTIRAAMVGRPGEIYNISGGNQASIRDVVQALEALLGKRLEVVYGDPVPGDAARTGGSNLKARDELGYAPTVDLTTGLAQQLEWARGLGASHGESVVSVVK